MDMFKSFDEVWQRVTGRTDEEEPTEEPRERGERVYPTRPAAKSAAVRFLPEF